MGRVKLGLVGPLEEEASAAMAEALAEDCDIVATRGREDYPLLRDVDCVILRSIRLDAEDIAAMPRLRFIQRWGVGVENVDLDAAGARGIPVTIARGANTVSVAEAAVLLMLAVLRNLLPLAAGTRRGEWPRDAYVSGSHTLEGKRVGLVGCGAIGREVAFRVRAFGAAVCYFDPFRLPPDQEAELGLEFRPLDELLAASDIVSLHAPVTDETRNLIRRETLARMKPTAILINTARGALVDEDALAEALRNGGIAGAALDTFREEPLRESPLFALPNAILTPHTAGSTAENRENMIRLCVDGIRRFARGEDQVPGAVVNLEQIRGNTP